MMPGASAEALAPFFGFSAGILFGSYAAFFDRSRSAVISAFIS